MEAVFSRFAEGGTAFVAILAAAVAVLAALLYLLRKRNTPEQREHRRRLQVNRQGRLTSGLVFEVEDGDNALPRLLHYTYKIGAVEYSACQDVETLAETVGADPKGVVGPASVKYHQKNPYNSIVICEEWSGLRGRTGRPS